MVRDTVVGRKHKRENEKKIKNEDNKTRKIKEQARLVHLGRMGFISFQQRDYAFFPLHISSPTPVLSRIGVMAIPFWSCLSAVRIFPFTSFSNGYCRQRAGSQKGILLVNFMTPWFAFPHFTSPFLFFFSLRVVEMKAFLILFRIFQVSVHWPFSFLMYVDYAPIKWNRERFFLRRRSHIFRSM
jgi:hypothetical protein